MHRRAWSLVLGVLSAVALASCAARDAPAPSPPISAAATTDYRLGVADKVRIIVFDEPTLSGDFVVNADGAISAPLIGSVQAAGLTATQIKADMEAKLGAGYLRHPNVSIDVLTFRPYFILGEVTKPGQYPYAAGLTILDAVATAEGFTHRANRRRVFVKHVSQAREVAEPLTSDLPVQPGDTIRFGERYF